MFSAMIEINLLEQGGIIPTRRTKFRTHVVLKKKPRRTRRKITLNAKSAFARR